MKTTQPLYRLIRQGESETLEFKESFGKDVIETVCAFGNSRKGAICEQWFSGIEKMMRECASSKMPGPVFEDKSNSFWIAFKKGNDRQASTEAPPKYPPSTPQVERTWFLLLKRKDCSVIVRRQKMLNP